MKRLFPVFLMIGLVLSGAIAFAQTYLGSINGIVTDATGAVIPKVTVTVTNVGKGITYTYETNQAGGYAAQNLEPGVYAVTAEAPHFKTITRRNLELEVARTLRIDFQMVPGGVSEKVSVTEEAPPVNTSNAVLESTFTNTQIVQLPLQGRDFQNLVVLNPGVQRTPGGGFQSITSNGNRVEDNNFIVDGIDDNDAYYGTTVINAEGVQGTPASHLPVDAIQEFNVQAGAEADYGWKPGAIVNIGIKSGTNDLHGSAYYFHRNSALDARNFFNPTSDPASALRLHEFGGSIGGPIVKEKIFFFANYEGVRDIVGNPLQLKTPMTVSAGGDDSISIPDAIDSCTADENCSQLSLNLLPLFPANPGTANPSDPTLQNFDFNNTNREDNGIVKIDYQYNPHHNFSARYFAGDSVQNEEAHNVLQPYWLDMALTRAQVLGASWNWMPAYNVVNQLRFGYNRFSQQIYTDDHTKPATDFGIITGVTKPLDYGFPEIKIGSFERLGPSTNWPLLTTPNLTYQISDNLTWNRGHHSLKFGGEFRTGSTDNIRDKYGKGYVKFKSLYRFMTGDYRSDYVLTGDTRRQVSEKSFGIYAQDDWRIKPRLTVTAGLRYDVSLPITEAHNQLANFDPATGQILQVGSQISQPYNTDWNNVAPRLGFAWDLFGTGKTVLRAGAGFMYEIPHISLYISQNGAESTGLATIPSGANGIAVQGGNITTGVLSPDLNWTPEGPVFGDVPSSELSCDFDTQCSILGVDRNIRTPYVVNWNLNLQHQITNGLTLQLAYVGNRGIKLYSIRNINQNQFYYDWVATGMGDPYEDTDGKSGRPFTNPALCGTHCMPYLGDVEMMENHDYSFYHGFQVTLKQRSYKGMSFVAGYTWSHAIDLYGSNRSYDWEDPNNPLLERGDASSDIRHRFTLAFTYQTPKLSRYDALLGGWTFNTILDLQTGSPRDLYDGDSAFSGAYTYNDRWNIFGDPRNLKWSLSGIPFITKWLYDEASDTYFVNSQWTSVCGPYAQGLIPGMNPGTDYPTTSDYAGGCYAQNGTVLAPPQWGSFGNMRRNVFRGPGYSNVDMSLAKTFKLNERLNVQLRGEVFNILNHPNFAGLEGDLESTTAGLAAYTPDVAASNPVVGSGGSRHIQLGVKIVF